MDGVDKCDEVIAQSEGSTNDSITRFRDIDGDGYPGLDERSLALYTRGSVEFFRTYPGMYVPRPLEMRSAHSEQTMAFLAREVLSLTKMNWNNTQFDGGEPITVKAADKVGDVLKYLGDDDWVAPRYSYYM